MLFLHDLLARVLFQMGLLMMAFSAIQVVRRQGVTKLYFTGVLFSGGFLILTALFGIIVALFYGRAPGALHLAYGAVAILTLPTIHHFERQSSDSRRAMNLYLVAYVVLVICLWRSMATG
jgi:hypothetical protein